MDNLNVDMVDGYHAGNGSGDIPISNNELNSYLNADMLDGFHQSELLPVGTIIEIAEPSENSIPNFLYCDGSAVNRTTYSQLFTRIGTTYGPGDE